MRGQLFCLSKRRVAALRALGGGSPQLNGIEYLEVGADQKRLELHFVNPLSPAHQGLDRSNVEIRGGVRVPDPAVQRVDVSAADVLTVTVRTPGDFSTYRLRLVQGAATDAPPPGIDPALAEIEFRFKVDCPSDFDCRRQADCPPEARAEPPIDYLARDYSSFRRLMLDRLSTLMPGWRERSPADLTVALVELLAFRADELSYFQDAVATEAYLGTARKRISVRRHARLLDYPFHDGANARALVAFEVSAGADGRELEGADPDTGLGGTMLLTRVRGLPPGAISAERAQVALDGGEAQAFELLQDVTLYEAHNEIGFHTWSDEECCLPRGATQAYLLDEGTARLRLRVGDVLVLEERRGTANGLEADADTTRRHAVRLTHVDPEAPLVDGVRSVPAARLDPVTGERFVEVAWHAEDALPFPLCLSKRFGGRLERHMAVVRGNVALADHGRTQATPVPLGEIDDPARYRPPLAATAIAPLSWQAPFDVEAPASALARERLPAVRPAVEVTGDGERWTAARDLLASGRFASEFVVETEDDGRAWLRFGDGVNGRRPAAGDELHARFRIGNGAAGNVGAEAIAHVVVAHSGIDLVRNPLPAWGGVEPHPIAKAKLYAPSAFRTQERAVTVKDYEEVAQRHPEVQRAVATRRWTGSWHTTFVTIDRRGGRPIEAEFEAELVRFLERFRLAGHDLEIDAPRFVPLDVALSVCTLPGYFPADVELQLLAELGALFHPDNFTFGVPVYLSAIVARAMDVPGVAFVEPLRFQRMGQSPADEVTTGRIAMDRLEIALLDNDPDAPENGKLDLRVHEGA